ncbi:MAG: putative nicotinate-nucleotide adenylyltransferase [Candidatus Gottesmanbacteria bacterium GW2011_GWA2_41_12]|uniref:Probable nicotinate-nucleotide adenylyltransferase n=2 Tax=Candidatus Gottesmaniibacteriota TaxID=1752720 RepID=A0A0G0ULY9_9BACT|nr:MAG: putative nicotinate-nucleotide adenylyltransferase [Candidatus Gottesmanbacteria bacterium GW2011_GWC2_39_8]KKR88546.1 MAG: putative nicotinate-nucleotide adenylyltransferase [Candidatus Gottesmanbacteria bacterium GW2011_GWA2_41_12]
MKIAIFGGGFNPPHLGHIFICDQVLAFTDNEEIWLMPYFTHPWEKNTIDPIHRYKMAKMVENKKVKVSDIEMKMGRKNYTWETIDILLSKYPEHQFSWIIGSDLWKDFFKWEKSEEFIKKIKILVFPRPGYPYEKLPDNVYTLTNKLLMTSNIASEKIREMVRQGLPIKGLVLPEVEKYILENKLYK